MLCSELAIFPIKGHSQRTSGPMGGKGSGEKGTNSDVGRGGF